MNLLREVVGNLIEYVKGELSGSRLKSRPDPLQFFVHELFVIAMGLH